MRCVRRGLVWSGVLPALAVLAGAGFFVPPGPADGGESVSVPARVDGAGSCLTPGRSIEPPGTCLSAPGPSLSSSGPRGGFFVRPDLRRRPPAPGDQTLAVLVPASARALDAAVPGNRADHGPPACERAARAGRSAAPSTGPPTLHG